MCGSWRRGGDVSQGRLRWVAFLQEVAAAEGVWLAGGSVAGFARRFGHPRLAWLRLAASNVIAAGQGQLQHAFDPAGVTLEWTIVWAADGIPEFVPPTWIDPERKPRRNTMHNIAALMGKP